MKWRVLLWIGLVLGFLAGYGTSQVANAATVKKPLLGAMSDPWHAKGQQIVSNYVPICSHQSFAARLDQAQKAHVALFVNLLPRAAHGIDSLSCDPAAIAAGKQDVYLKQMRADIASRHVLVIIRYAPEFIGSWETWHGHSEAYVASWRHLWSILHPVAKLSWSPGLPWIGMSHTAWYRTVLTYWPGSKYVDYVDSTTVPHPDAANHNKMQAWSYFSLRLPYLLAFHKPLTLGEVGPTIWPQATLWAKRHNVVAVVRFG